LKLLSDEELNAIQAVIATYKTRSEVDSYETLYDHLASLLAEVRCLRRELKVARAIVEFIKRTRWGFLSDAAGEMRALLAAYDATKPAHRMATENCDSCERIHRLEVALEIACRREARPRPTYPDFLRLADEEIAKEKSAYDEARKGAKK